MHVGLNNYGVVPDFYYPYVGYENHAAGEGLRHKLGIWIDGEVHWTDGPGWSFEYSYPIMLIGRILARNDGLGILLEFEDLVDAEMSVYLQKHTDL